MSFGPSVRNGLGIGLGPTATLATAFSQATLDFDFIDNLVFPTDITFTRASSATMFDSSGTLIFAPMNAIRNNTMVGAVAGTPGTLPTNWLNPNSAGLTTNVSAIGIQNGISYIDVQITGTTNATSYTLAFEAATQIAALQGQTWTFSSWISIIAGDFTNVTAAFVDIRELNSGGSQVASGAVSISLPSSTFQRIVATRTNTEATTAFVQPRFRFTVNNTSAVNFTLRIGMPQLQLGSTATAVNATSGTAYQAPRLDYNPTTLAARGLLIEEQRTNSIRNNTMQGAVAPSTFPTNWQNVIVAGLTATVVGTGTQNGITYLDVRVNGTPSVSTYYNLVPDILVAGASGQTWTGSFWLSLISGSLTNTNCNIEIRESDAAQGFLTNTLTLLPVTSTLTRYSQTRTLNNASTAFVSVRSVWQVTSGLPVDFTLRIGLPQLEQGAFATSVISTTTAAATRSADVASVNTLSPWFNAAEGTLYADWTSLAPNGAPGGLYYAATLTDNTTTSAAIQLTIQSRALNNQIRIWQSVTGGGLDESIQPSFTSFQGKAATNYGGGINVSASANGGAVVTMVNPLQSSAFNALQLGAASGNTGYLNGHIRRITYYPSRLSNAQLQALTA